ncbi:MAG: hypothetical protein QXJ19_04895 [Candidatus Bathyarchaeia archaeon]|nr:hypothetical protein [Candidatus Bathyarchaeota archaeon]
MGRRLKAALTLFAIGLIGFIFGIIANTIYFRILPLLTESFSYIFASSLIAWGLVGALAAIICCIIYAYLL